MNNKLVVLGDEHVRQETPFIEAKVDYFNWLIEQPFNNNNNTLLQVGDLFHRSLPTPIEVNTVVDFLVRSKFKQILIMSGNGQHEYSRGKDSYAIEALGSIPRVKLIFLPCIQVLKNISILMLPWIPDSKYDGIKDMKEYYENLPSEISDRTYDYIFGHFACKTFFENEINIDYLTGKKRMGHIHFPDETYVGANTITRGDERGMKYTINIIDTITGSEELYPIPTFIDYYSVKYLDPVKCLATHPILEIYDAPSISAAKEHYSKYHIASITTLDEASESIETSSNRNGSLSLVDHMNNFIKEKNIDKDTQLILKEKIREVV